MGRMQAEEMAALADQDTALCWHLESNHYPPIDLVFLDTAKWAIEQAQEGNWETTREMPNGLTRSVSEIVEGLHLDAFITIEGG